MTNAKGVIRIVDDIGRVAIPRNFRKEFGIKEGDEIEFHKTKGGKIYFKKHEEGNENVNNV